MSSKLVFVISYFAMSHIGQLRHCVTLDSNTSTMDVEKAETFWAEHAEWWMGLIPDLPGGCHLLGVERIEGHSNHS